MQRRRLTFQFAMIIAFSWFVTTGCNQEKQCVTGRTVECPCPGPEAGQQTCREDQSWGTCQCPSDHDAGPIADTEPEDVSRTDVPDDTEATDTADTPDGRDAADATTRDGEADGSDGLPSIEVVDESKMTEVQVDVDPGDEVSDIIGNVDSGELLVFPSGTFQWSSRALVLEDNWGIRAQEDTFFEVPEGWGDGDQTRLLKTVAGGNISDNVLLENLTFVSSGRAAPGIRLGVRKAAHIKGLHYDVNGPISDRDHANGMSAFATNDDGMVLIDNYRQFNNGDLGGYGGGDSRVGIYGARRNDGTVKLRNPVLQGFPNNGCYVGRQPGKYIIEGGLLMNNNVSAVRVSGNVEVHDTTVYIDIDQYLDGPGVIEASQHNTRGFWGDMRGDGSPGGIIKGASVILKNYQRCTGLATILENPRMSVEDTQFLLDTDIDAVQAGDGEIDVTNCTFDGSADSATAGVGDVSGSGNRVSPDIDPGQVTVDSQSDYEFDWSRTHPDTPDRSQHVGQ